MKVTLRDSEAKLLRFAIEIAIGSEEELISCHTDRWSGKSFDTEVTDKSKRTIRRMRKLWRKLKAAAEAAQ